MTQERQAAPSPEPKPAASGSSWFALPGWTRLGDDGTLTRPDGARGELPPPNIPGYEIQRELGRGGMGVVYLAQQLKLNRPVALKVILGGGDPGQVARFRLEAEAVARLAHPNVVQIHDVGEHEGRLFLALEYVAGGSLADALKRQPMAPRAAASLVADLARGIHAAHQAGIIHRDLKPANVLLAEPAAGGGSATTVLPSEAPAPSTRGVPKVTDFGLAKRLEGESQITQSGVIVGTPSYMAPEQASGKPNAVTTLADIYGLGAIFFECLTGRPPFLADSPMETLLQVLQEPAPSPRALNPAVDPDLALICAKCLAKEPKERYGTAEALAKDLERWQVGETISVHAPTVGTALRRWVRQNFGAAGWTVPIGIGYGLIIALLFWFFGRSQMMAVLAKVYAQLPSKPQSWLLSLRIPDGWYPMVFLGLFTSMASMGYLAARLIRPRNWQADLTVGLVTGTIASLFFFLSAGSWFLDEQLLLPILRQQDLAIRTSTLIHPSERLADPEVNREQEAARAAFLARHPDFRAIPHAERARIWSNYLVGEMATAGPRALLAGLLFSFICGLTFCTGSVMIGGLTARRHAGWGRSLLAYLELMLPAAFLFAELVTQFLGWYSPRLTPRGPVEAALVLVSMAAALVAAIYRWNRWARLGLFFLWASAFVATILGLKLPPLILIRI